MFDDVFKEKLGLGAGDVEQSGEQERRKVAWLDEGQATRLLSQQSN